MHSNTEFADLAPHPESDSIDGIEYDKYYRMKYHPDFHPNHGMPFSDEDLEYLCTFYEIDSCRTMAFALGKTEHTIRSKYNQLKKNGLIEHYKKMYEQKLEE